MNKEYLDVVVQSNVVSAYDEAGPSRLAKEANIVDAETTGALALHAMTSIQNNRNTRRRQLFEGKGKSREKIIPESELPRKIRRTSLKSRDNLTPPTVEASSNGGNSDIFIARKGRALPEGLGSLGTRALHIKAKVHSVEMEPVRTRLDSGADITLMSEEFYKSIPGLPKIKEGLRMKLYHLTGNASVLGYTRTNLFATAIDGTVISFELEAYVVRGMQVPLLVGEDFQTTYELGLQRHATGHCEVLVGRDGRYSIAASSAASVDLGFEIRQAFQTKSFVRAKTLRRAKSKAARGSDASPVVAVEDVKISPGSVHNVRVSAAFGDQEMWLVEKILIGTDTADVLAAPTTWINSASPYIPIANPSPRPWYIKIGDVVGYLVHSDELDHPNEAAREKYIASAERIRAVIAGTLRQQDLGNASVAPEPCDDRLADDDAWGPKTTALPDEKVSGDVSTLVNLGPDIPDDVLPKLTALLRKHESAFGVDGRLGQVDAKVEIPLKPGTKPISVPMYGASPAKREVIEKQINAWFEADVIEPSSSPWGFPVVVVYRNGKPRLVVDYRKLNAHTIPDEFPIPRQSEIIQALSGSQVLSSFDALAGFTQLEMEVNEKEKTAFRCHLGLFQFKRMPFGLRNGPSIFQRIMQGVLSPFLWLFALVYIDDIVIFSKSWDDHLVHLDKVLGAISAAGITLSPSKCFVGFASILLLGQKVSRLGLSTHAEKVAAIMELERPKSLQELQRFLGMVVYFSQYIPFYSFIAAPLFTLLRKGVKWQWKEEQEIAWMQAKDALAGAPVLGHPVPGSPYRLYTDASDLALGASLQQVQQIQIKDLEGTTMYERLLAAWEARLPIPSLFVNLSKDVIETNGPDTWGATFEDTYIHVERVIAYWSRTLKPAERNYSATEREALGAKEALVKFQPFIEGEQIILVTDHAALQWARVYENANRRLAAWGAVFAAYPGLTIVHRAGRVHSNVDPLSRMPRVPPHSSPIRDDIPDIIQSEEKRSIAQNAEDKRLTSPAARAAFVVWWWEDIVEKYANPIQTRSRYKATGEELLGQPNHKNKEENASTADSEEIAKSIEVDDYQSSEVDPTLDSPASTKDELPFPEGGHWTYPATAFDSPFKARPEEERKSHLLISMDPNLIQEFITGYKEDPFFKSKYSADEIPSHTKVITPSHFRKGKNGLLYFFDADFNAKLCIPKSKVNYVLSWIHNSPYESAHAGPKRFLLQLQEVFYWKGMEKDAELYARTCDVCQKIKVDHRKQMGALRPAHIPSRPFATVSIDLITGLPPSGVERYTAVLVVVDKLTKFATIIPTYNQLDQDGFAKLFVERIVNVFGLPERIISDRDPRWATDFWKSVVKHYGGIMALSSSHHPQTDGQTEILNATIEQMLRAYVADNRSSWSQWLSVLAFAYNSSVHSSTLRSPNFLLFGYHPRLSTSTLNEEIDPTSRPYLPSQKAETFIETLQTIRNSARNALVLAQEKQAKAFNKGRRPVEEIKEGDLVLINPHTLKLVDVQGTGKKLVQRTLGPFEVVEVINPMVYRLCLPLSFPMHPVFNLQHLKKYHPSPQEFGDRVVLPSTRPDFEEFPEYEVEAILGHRLTNKATGNRREYLVRWKNYGPADDEWISEDALRNSPTLKREYLRLHNL